MLIYYKHDSASFFMVVLHPMSESSKDLENYAVSHKEYNKNQKVKDLCAEARSRICVRDRGLTFNTNDGFDSSNAASITSLQALMALPVGKDLLSLFKDEGEKYAIKSMAEMKLHLKGRRKPPDCLLAKVMPVLEDFLIRTAYFDMSLKRNANTLDDDLKKESTEMIERFARVFAGRIQEIIDAHRREKVFTAAEEQKAANSLLLMDLELLEAEDQHLSMPSLQLG
jgi:hypothetical protein